MFESVFLNPISGLDMYGVQMIYYCPHLATDNCECRKPGIGMLSEAVRDFPNINIASSYLVGDSITDIQAGEIFGLKTVHVDNQFTLYSWVTEFLEQ